MGATNAGGVVKNSPLSMKNARCYSFGSSNIFLVAVPNCYNLVDRMWVPGPNVP